MQRNRFFASLSWLILAPLAGCAHDVPTTVDVTGNAKPGDRDAREHCACR